MMTLSSLSPLFILWAIRGTDLLPNTWFVLGCLITVLVPNLILGIRIVISKKQNDKKTIMAGPVEDYSARILIYLFAILLPFYTEEITSFREMSAMIVALAVIILIFWRLDLHYLNLFFLIFGYRAFMVFPPSDDNPHTGKQTLVLITYRRYLIPQEQLTAYRLSDTVYLETRK